VSALISGCIHGSGGLSKKYIIGARIRSAAGGSQKCVIEPKICACPKSQVNIVGSRIANQESTTLKVVLLRGINDISGQCPSRGSIATDIEIAAALLSGTVLDIIAAAGSRRPSIAESCIGCQDKLVCGHSA